MPVPWIRDAPGGVHVTVRVRPRARPGLAVAGIVLMVSVASPPVEGRATEEARRVLARALEVAPRAVTVRSGKKSRSKVFLVAGLSGRVASDRIGRALGRPEG